MKTCSACGAEKDEAEFYPQKRQCKKCIHERQRRYQREYRNRPEVRESRQEHRRRRYENDPDFRKREQERKREQARSSYQNNPEIRERKREYQRQPEVREHRMEYKREYQRRPEVREYHREYNRDRPLKILEKLMAEIDRETILELLKDN